MLPTIAREGDVVVMIDQRKLPAQEVYVRCKTAPEVARAIKTMVIRGAPAIGVAAAKSAAVRIGRELLRTSYEVAVPVVPSSPVAVHASAIADDDSGVAASVVIAPGGTVSSGCR